MVNGFSGIVAGARQALVVSFFAVAMAAGGARAQEYSQVHNLKVVTDATPDMTSVEAIIAQIDKPGRSEEQKAEALRLMVRNARYWGPGQRLTLRSRLGGTDPIMILNNTMCTICQQDAEMMIALWNLMGYSTRMHQLGWHTSPEIWYDGKWRHFDATFDAVTRDKDGEVTTVLKRDEIYGVKDDKPWVRHNAYISRMEPYALGHTMGLTLRPGETFTRYWGPLSKSHGYYVPASDGRRPHDRVDKDGSWLAKAMTIVPRPFEAPPDDATYGNGVWVFEPDLGSDDWTSLAEQVERMDVKKLDGKAMLQPGGGRGASYAVFRVRSPYIMTGGKLSATVAATGDGNALTIEGSTDNGKNWQPLLRDGAIESGPVSVDLETLVSTHFDYLVRLTMRAGERDAEMALGDLRIETITQANPFVLPALRPGKTTVKVEAGEQMERITFTPDFESGQYRQVITEAKNVQRAKEVPGGPAWSSGLAAMRRGEESHIVMRVDTPRDLERLTVGGRFTARPGRVKLFYSLDSAEWTELPFTYKQAGKTSENELRGTVVNYETVSEFPAETRTVYVKVWFAPKDADADPEDMGLLSGLRIDAWYPPPAKYEMPPVEVTYNWQQLQDGEWVEKTHTQVVKELPASYEIEVDSDADAQPRMKWVRVKLAE